MKKTFGLIGKMNKEGYGHFSIFIASVNAETTHLEISR